MMSHNQMFHMTVVDADSLDEFYTYARIVPQIGSKIMLGNAPAGYGFQVLEVFIYYSGECENDAVVVIGKSNLDRRLAKHSNWPEAIQVHDRTTSEGKES